MRRYWWPGYGTQLLEELQRQQNTTQFCDTLLQTEGISVPAHSCILAALSPYLSQKLSASPLPAPGQKRLLQLQPVRAQTLLQLVGLLYSGKLEVREAEEQNEVLAAAHIFGIKDLVEGDRNGKMEEELQEKMRLLGSFKENSSHAGGGECKESRKSQDVQVQAEMAGRRDVDSPAENRNCMMIISTQTGEKPFGDCFTSDCAPPVAQNVEVSSMLQPQSIMIDEQFCFSSCPIISSMTSRALNDAVAASGRPTTSDLSNNTLTFPHSLDDDTNPTEDQTHPQSKEYWKSLQEKAKRTGPDGKTTGQTLDSRETTEEPHQAKNMEKGNSTEKRNPRSNVGAKNLANMKRMQMLETTQISIKVKLRRRTKGEVWEVVRQQDADETVAVLASHKQDGFNCKRLQKNLPPCVVEPDILNLPPHPNTCGCQPPSCDINLNQKDGLGTTPCPQHQESDEQLEKLLEDIMMGLNILPNVEKDFKKSHDLQQGHVGATGQVPVTQNIPEHGQVRPAVSVPRCTFSPDMGTRSCHSVSETAEKPPDCGLSAVQQVSVSVLQQLQRAAEGTSCESTSRSKIQECLHEEPRTKLVMAPTAFCAGQKQHQEAPAQDTEHILDHVPTATDAETQSEYSVVLSWMNEMQIPPCLSPLGPCTSAAKNQAIPYQGSRTDNLTLHIQQQASLHGLPWLTESHGCQRFPPDALTVMKNETAEPCTMKHLEKRETISGYQQDGAEPNSEPRKIMDSLKCKQAGVSGELVATKRRKRKRTSDLQDTAPLLAYKGAGGTKYVKMSSCSVSLSTNNILAKERERAISSLNIPSRLKRNAHPLSPTAQSLKEKTKEKRSAEDGAGCEGGEGDAAVAAAGGRNADRTPFKTRGFMKKESLSDAQPPVRPVACRAPTVNNSPLVKRKRGRPPKLKVVDLTPTNNNAALVHEKNNSGQSQDNPVFLSNVRQEIASQMGHEGQPLKNQNEGKFCDAAGSSATPADLIDAGGLSRSTSSDKEEEEVEVDILLSSPHRTPPVTALDIEIPPDEEKEEEEEMIDVTGDEAE